VSIVGIGQDLVELPRIRRAVERHGSRFLHRCYTDAELQYCQRLKDPIPSLAARFAAKEAAAKALGTGIACGVGWRDIEVLREPGHAPRLLLHGRARERGERLQVSQTHISLTHGREVASAVVILEKLSS
jgi:holo-[acyl-carrier protein] synthase